LALLFVSIDLRNLHSVTDNVREMNKWTIQLKNKIVLAELRRAKFSNQSKNELLVMMSSSKKDGLMTLL
jgi:hypothetical protein